MTETEEEQLSELFGKIDIVHSLIKALITCMCGTEELTKADACNFVSLLDDKLNELKLDCNNFNL